MRGGQEVVHECLLERMPVFARAGSIVPMGPQMVRSDEKPVDPLTLEVYAGPQAAEFDLYEDDGLSLDYRAGAYAWTSLRFLPEGANYRLIIGPAKGKFKGELARRRYCVRVHGLFKPQGIALNGRISPQPSRAATRTAGGGTNWTTPSRFAWKNRSPPAKKRFLSL